MRRIRGVMAAGYVGVASMLVAADALPCRIDTNATEKRLLSNEELVLMYRAFLYDNRPQDAYKTAKLARKLYPEEFSWHERLAQSALWSDHPSEALREMLAIYRREPKAEMEKKLVELGLQFHQYDKLMPVVRRRMLRSTEKRDIDLFVYVWTRAGEPVEAASVLFEVGKKRDDAYAVEKAFALFLEAGETADAKKAAHYLEALDTLSPHAASLLAYFHYIRHDIDKAFATLMAVWNRQKEDPDYLRKVSDLGWYLGKRKEAAAASLALIRKAKGKVRDYERIMALGEEERGTVAEVSWDAWQKYRKRYHFYNYAYAALASDDVGKLYERMLSLLRRKKDFAPFAHDVQFFLLLAEASKKAGDLRRALWAQEKAYALAPDDIALQAALLWSAFDMHDPETLRHWVRRLEKGKEVPVALYLPLASAHFELQHIDRALFYIRRLLSRYPDRVEYLLMYAYLLQAQGDETAAAHAFGEAFAKLRERRKSNPSSMKDPVFTDRYLQAAMQTLGAERFERLLRDARHTLGEERYAYFETLWALRNDGYDKARVLTRSLHRIEPWLGLSLALHFDDAEAMRRYVYLHALILSAQDSVAAAKRLRYDALAFSAAFEGAENNRRNDVLVREMAELAFRNAAETTAVTGVTAREGARSVFLNAHHRSETMSGWQWEARLAYARNRITDTAVFAYLPSREIEADVRITRRFDRGEWSLDAGIRKATARYFTASWHCVYRAGERWSIDVEAGMGQKAEETSFLLFGGYKNTLNVTATYTLLPSTTLEMRYMYGRYKGQDGSDAGPGTVGGITLTKRYRVGYPDISASLFAEFGRFDEQDEAHRTFFAPFSPYEDFNVMPDDYTVVGLHLSYGVNAISNGKTWRPYLSLSPRYSTATDEAAMSFYGGIEGKLWGSGRIDIGVVYDQILNGTQESVLKVHVGWQWFY